MRSIWGWSAGLLLGSVAAGIASGQQAPAAGRTVVIHAVVTDSAGQPIEGAEVQVSDSARRKTLASVRTAANGVANITGLASGSRYVILSRKVGYAPTMSAPLALGDKDTLETDIELDKIVLLSDVNVKGKSNPQYTIDDRQLGKLPIDNLRLGEALRRYRKRMLGDNYKMCRAPDFIYVNGVRWSAHGAAFHPLGEIFASDILSVRYFDCWESDFPDLRNSIVIVLKPGVEFPAKNYGEAQRKPTR